MESKIYEIVKDNWGLEHQDKTKYNVEIEFMDDKSILFSASAYSDNDKAEIEEFLQSEFGSEWELADINESATNIIYQYTVNVGEDLNLDDEDLAELDRDVFDEDEDW